MSRSRCRSSRPTRPLAEDDKARRIAAAARTNGRACTTQVKAQGGLRIIATERHESRRIDNQLRGRSGRQGDPGSVALLPVAGRSADAHLRRRPRQGHHGPAEDARGRGDRGRHRHAQHRKRAAQGRGAQLRHPQAAARVRRRRQRPAQGDLPAAQRDPRVGVARRADRQPATQRDDRPGAQLRAGGERRGAVGHARPGEGAEGRVAARAAAAGSRSTRATPSPTTTSSSKVVAAADALFAAKVQAGRRRAVHPVHAHGAAADRSTATGASTWPRSTTCARASTCAAMRRRTRSRNTSARPSSCSRSCSTW